jgi:UDP-N-acetylglucosamine 1-carboxyvinyltransferase
VKNSIIPDMIEAGTYLAAGVACRGPVTVRSVNPSHLGALLEGFADMGVETRIGADHITAFAPNGYRNIAVCTGPFPAFPTDLHPPLTVLLSRTAGGVICDLVWHDRFSYVEELKNMGLCAASAKGSVRVWQSRLQGCSVTAPDLRGGAALVTAALIAEGESRIAGERLIARGYEDFAEKLYTLGADIRIVPEG